MLHRLLKKNRQNPLALQQALLEAIFWHDSWLDGSRAKKIPIANAVTPTPWTDLLVNMDPRYDVQTWTVLTYVPKSIA